MPSNFGGAHFGDFLCPRIHRGRCFNTCLCPRISGSIISAYSCPEDNGGAAWLLTYVLHTVNMTDWYSNQRCLVPVVQQQMTDQYSNQRCLVPVVQLQMTDQYLNLRCLVLVVWEQMTDRYSNLRCLVPVVQQQMTDWYSVHQLWTQQLTFATQK